MPYICKNCPNKIVFYRINEMREYYSETEFLDEDGGAHDWERGEGDSETIEHGTITCVDCESTLIEEVTTDDWEDWKGPENDTPITATNWKERYNR
jgi:hypothetical protein